MSPSHESEGAHVTHGKRCRPWTPPEIVRRSQVVAEIYFWLDRRGGLRTWSLRVYKRPSPAPAARSLPQAGEVKLMRCAGVVNSRDAPVACVWSLIARKRYGLDTPCFERVVEFSRRAERATIDRLVDALDETAQHFAGTALRDPRRASGRERGDAAGPADR